MEFDWKKFKASLVETRDYWHTTAEEYAEGGVEIEEVNWANDMGNIMQDIVKAIDAATKEN